MATVLVKSFSPPKIDKKEILRYAGAKVSSPDIEKEIDLCLKEIENKLSFLVCYAPFSIRVNDTFIDIEGEVFNSKSLSKNLQKCDTVVLFGATIGVYIDRLIQKYGRISPLKALIFQAIGVERIESLCNEFCTFIKNEYKGKKIRPRFSAGYGDLSIYAQKQIFNLLNCSKNISLTLNDSLVMSPSKSVTAFIGLSNEGCEESGECSCCEKTDCEFRR